MELGGDGMKSLTTRLKMQATSASQLQDLSIVNMRDSLDDEWLTCFPSLQSLLFRNCSFKTVCSDAESRSYPLDSELELGLRLSLGGGGNKGKGNPWGECGRILSAKDFPSSGSKRAAELVSNDSGSPTATASQVVGWPPIRTYRINNLVNQAKASRSEQDKPSKDESKDGLSKKICNGNEKGYLGFVKVNMDGVAIGRKIDLNAHTSYETLAKTLEDMFFRSNSTITSIGSVKEKQDQRKPCMLLDGSSDFVLTYEDKDGDWMLVGDVPFGMFLSSVKRLRIMKTCEAKGLAPRFQDQKRSKPT